MMGKAENHPITLPQFQAADGFWKDKMELVRTSVIPFQWEMLNDRVEGAAPSFCMRNFEIAGKLTRERKEKGSGEEKGYIFPGFYTLPEAPDKLEEKFYGFVFQDSDFSKWIEAVAYSLSCHPDPELEKIADGAIDIVCAAQQENGYLDTFFIINGMDGVFTNTKDLHELYCFGHLTEGAVAYYQATGKKKLLQAAIRFADFIDSYFGPEKEKAKGYPGHEIAEMALVRLYEVTKEERYLNLSKYFVDERGKQPYYWKSETGSVLNMEGKGDKPEGEFYHYNQAHRPVREQEEAVGHAVRAMYLYSGMADVARLTEDESLKEACRKIWNSVVREKMYITGGIGATHIGEAFSFPFDLPNDTVYAETCASIGLIFFARRMLQMQVDRVYADVMEQALYNTVLAGMGLDGKSFFYVNPLEVVPEACHKDDRKEHVEPVRPKWYGCACCPPNLARLISSIPTYAFTENEDTLFMHLHISGNIAKEVNGKKGVFQVESQMPWGGKVAITYCGEDSNGRKLAVRIPGWCEKWTVEGQEAFTCKEENGYFYLEGNWTDGTRIVFDFDMAPQFYQADARVREDIGKVALMRGPVVYCAEEVDNGKDLHLIQVLPEGAVREECFAIQDMNVPAVYVKAQKEVHHEKAAQLYTRYVKPEIEEMEVKMIPYFAWANRGENEMMVWMRQK